MSDPERLKCTVYVGGLASQVDQSHVHAAFLPFGEIIDISLPKPEAPSSTELHRGFGYVEFEDADDAKEAIDNMDQAELFGRVIKVSAAKPQKAANEGLGSKTALWEQVQLTRINSQLSLDTNRPHRKGGSRRTQSARRTEWLLIERARLLLIEPMTQCKDLKDWMLLDQGPREIESL
jgi:RNA recognition motif-containing protein